MTTMRLKRLMFVLTAGLTFGLVGATHTGATPPPIWGWDGFPSFVDGGVPFQLPSALAVGDLDGDGVQDDLVVADSATNTVHVQVYNSPFGGVGDSPVYATGNLPSSVAIGDLNGDPYPDLVIANAGAGNISVRFGADNGVSTPLLEWLAEISYATGLSLDSQPLSVAIGDLDTDGDEDIAVANFGDNNPAIDSGSVTVLKNSSGNFLDRTELAAERPTSVAIADLDGNGRMDLVVSQQFTDQATGGVFYVAGDWLQDLAGILVEDTTVYHVGESPRDLAIADLNDDGRLDLVTANEGSNTVTLVLSVPSAVGLWAERIDVATGVRPVSVAVADLNLDGVPDLATANDSGSVSVLVGVGNGTFLTREDIPNGSNPALLVPDSPAAIAGIDWDFAQDGKPDLLVAGGGANPLVALVNQSGPDTPTGSNVVVVPVDRNTGNSPVTIRFGLVTAAGVTSLASSSTGPAAPAGFVLAGVYYELATTAVFDTAEVCFTHSLGFPPVVGHYVSGAWEVPPLTASSTATMACIEVTSFSPFALFQPEAPPADTDAPVIGCGSADGVWHGANVSIGCTASDAGSGLADAADAAFSLATSVPPGTEDGNASTASRQVCDVAGNCATAGPIGGNKVDRKAPALSLPADRTVDATSAAGAVATYSATAADGADPSPSVSCSPTSGATFAIGATTVACTATDHVGNASSGSFHVTVLGAKEQLNRLIQKVVNASKLPPATKTQLIAKLQALVASFDPSKPAQRQAICSALKLFTAAVQLLSGHGIPAAQAAEWIADANRIRTVLAC